MLAGLLKAAMQFGGAGVVVRDDAECGKTGGQGVLGVDLVLFSDFGALVEVSVDYVEVAGGGVAGSEPSVEIEEVGDAECSLMEGVEMGGGGLSDVGGDGGLVFPCGLELLDLFFAQEGTRCEGVDGRSGSTLAKGAQGGPGEGWASHGDRLPVGLR